MRNFDKIVTSINNLRHDIKAEAIIADIIENGINSSDIVAIPEGLFKRRFNHDVSRTGIKKLNNGQDVLEIYITRDGIYDALPEGLFHEQARESGNKGREIAKESKKQRMEEKEARLFFLPFENELFLQGINLELEERKILNRFSENLFDDIFPEFWNLDKTIPHKFLSRLVLILHFAHIITGNLKMTAKTLEIIIKENVKVNFGYPKPSNNNNKATNKVKTLGSSSLGVDCVCQQQFNDFNPVLEFVIGPLKNSRIEDYLEKGQTSKFLNCFFGYFVPIEMDYTTTILVSQEELNFTLNDSGCYPILGYNSAI